MVGGRLQLIVDEHMLHVLNSFLKMGDLHAEGVTSMDLIERQREPLPDLDALYLLRPLAENVDRVLADYRGDAGAQHRQVHLAFTHPVPAPSMARLAEGKHLAPRVRSLVEVPLSFTLIQDRGFHFDMLSALPGLFPVAEPGLVADISHRLADVCLCLQVTSPCIRHAPTPACQAIAEQLQTELSVCRPATRDNQVPCQLLIVDRSVDMAATLVHEYTYEAMAYDLLDGRILDIDRNLVTLKGPPARELLLNEADPLWEELKHAHLEEAVLRVRAEETEVRQQNAGQRNAGQMKTSELLDMLRKSPEQRDQMDRLFLHMTLIEHMNLRLREERMTDGLGLLEQDIACGVDRDGKDMKAEKLQRSLTEAFVAFEKVLPSESKLRLLMLYFSCWANISEVVRQKLIESARLAPEDQEVLMNMLRTRLMEVPDAQRQKLGTGCVHRGTKEQAARFRQNARSDGHFELSRFEPRIKQVIELLTQGHLRNDDFPILGGSDAGDNHLRSAGAAGCAPPGAPAVQAGDAWSFGAWPSAAAGGAAEAKDDAPAVTQRVVVFVLGGLTHSELRAAAEAKRALPRGTEVLLGGTCLLTPRRLIEALRPKGKGAQSVADPLDLT